jgi:antitoxin component of RelBE/YafQ-DinJ toxin-antitoxin module
MAKTEYIQIKVTPEFKKQVQDYCDATGRTITSLIEWLLREEMKKVAQK